MVNRRILLRSQQNEIYELITENGLDPRSFNWSEVKRYDFIYSQLNYNEFDFLFLFQISSEYEYNSIYYPGKNISVQYQSTNNWTTQKQHVVNWLYLLKKEVSQPNLWGQITKYKFSYDPDLTSKVSNEPFTNQQLEQVHKSLNQLKNYLIEHIKVSEEQHKLINENINYLSDSAKRQGRRDFIFTAIGLILSLASFLGIQPNQITKLFYFFRDTVIGFITSLPK